MKSRMNNQKSQRSCFELFRPTWLSPTHQQHAILTKLVYDSMSWIDLMKYGNMVNWILSLDTCASIYKGNTNIKKYDPRFQHLGAEEKLLQSPGNFYPIYHPAVTNISQQLLHTEPPLILSTTLSPFYTT